MGKHAPSTTDQRTDADLLAAVATDRCRDAFGELVKRYQRSAYNLARHITHSDALAEEAAQEAMLRVWLAAKNFKAGGNAQGWIHQIVVREALTTVRTRSVNTKRVQRAARLLPRVPETETPEADRDELLLSLRQCLGDLPDLNRQLVALYFGAGLSQAQVGQSLKISQRTVGHKLEETLKLLRSRLAQAGFAAAAPALLDDTIAQAVRGGLEPPAHLYANVMEGLERAAASVAKHSARAAAAKGSSAALWIVLAVAAAGSTAWWLSSQAPAASSAPSPASVPAASLSEKSDEPQSVSAEKEPGLIARWDFAQAPAGKGFRIFNDRWLWSFDKDLKQKAMRNVGSQETMGVLLPVRLPQRPFVVTLHYTVLKSGAPTLGLRWAKDEVVLPYTKYLLAAFQSVDRPATFQVIKYQYLFFDRYFAVLHNGGVTKIGVYEQSWPGDALSFVSSNMVTTSIEVRAVDIGDLPPKVRTFAEHPQAYLKQCKDPIKSPAYGCAPPYHAPETE